MSFIYLVALLGVAVIILCVLSDAIASVTSKPAWESMRRPILVEVETVDSRRQDLPFVGEDRRAVNSAAKTRIPMRKVG